MKIRCKFCGFRLSFADTKKSYEEGISSVCLKIQCDNCEWECFGVVEVETIQDPEERI